ncbi:MAG TPA: redox-sensitive transcriptional activator SoxR [Allosphingosinicella sp.]|nr:redox-sensitive transcriptional activator SoxR [Allosphingosinicella sp.]
MHKTDMLAIGDLAARTGLSVSAIRFYEARGLVSALRNAGGQRRFLRSDIRRLSFIRIAQQLGFTIEEIGGLLAALPQGRTPTQKDWAKISRVFRRRLDERIAAMSRMREKLDECIGCGCLSLRRCALYNPQDRLGRQGAGPQLLKVWDVSA